MHVASVNLQTGFIVVSFIASLALSLDIFCQILYCFLTVFPHSLSYVSQLSSFLLAFPHGIHLYGFLFPLLAHAKA